MRNIGDIYWYGDVFRMKEKKEGIHLYNVILLVFLMVLVGLSGFAFYKIHEISTIYNQMDSFCSSVGFDAAYESDTIHHIDYFNCIKIKEGKLITSDWYKLNEVGG